MKRFIKWLAKVFKAETTKTVYVDRVKEVYIPENGEIKGKVIIDGDLTVTGSLYVTGEITCHELKREGGQDDIA